MKIIYETDVLGKGADDDRPIFWQGRVGTDQERYFVSVSVWRLKSDGCESPHRDSQWKLISPDGGSKEIAIDYIEERMQTRIDNLDWDTVPSCDYCGELEPACQCSTECPECPICGDTAADWIRGYRPHSIPENVGLEQLMCNHLVFGWDDGGFDKSLDSLSDFPTLPEEVAEKVDSIEHLDQIFGEAFPLLVCYGDDFTQEPDMDDIYETLLELIPDSKSSSSCITSGYGGPGEPSWDAFIFAANDVEKAEEKINNLMEKLKQGFTLIQENIS